MVKKITSAQAVDLFSIFLDSHIFNELFALQFIQSICFG